VLFDRICLNNGIKAHPDRPYSQTTTGKIERLHKTMRKEFSSENSFETIDQAQAALDAWVIVWVPVTRFSSRRPLILVNQP